MKKKFRVTLDISWEVEAENEEEANELVQENLDNYAGSNDGSELIANAGFTLEEIKE